MQKRVIKLKWPSLIENEKILSQGLKPTFPSRHAAIMYNVHVSIEGWNYKFVKFKILRYYLVNRVALATIW